MKRILVAFSLVASLFHPHQTSYERMIDRVSASIVHITGWRPDVGDGAPISCTGFMVRRNRVLTAAHCLAENLKADGEPTAILRANPSFDLALLDVVIYKAPLEFADDAPARFEDVTAIGYAFGWNKLSALRQRVILVDSQAGESAMPGLIMQGGLIGGMSGGPIVNDAGEVVGINQQANEGIGYGIGAQLMKAFLLGAE